MFYIINNLCHSELTDIYKEILNLIGICINEKNIQYIQRKIHYVLIKYFIQVFNRELLFQKFYNNFCERYKQFHKKRFMNYKETEFNELFMCNSFKVEMFCIM